jgi:MscS family membrane protein
MLEFIESTTWIIKMLAIISITLVLSYIAGYLINYLEKKLLTNKAVWDDIALRSAKKPLKNLIWILGATLALRVTGNHVSVNLHDLVVLFTHLGIILCIAWFIWRMVAEYENHFTKNHSKGTVDVTTVVAIGKLIKIIIFIITSLMILQSFGINIAGVIAFGGIGGIAIGFASKDLLANFFGALVIFLDRPFLVGEHIRSPDRKIEGTVKYIGWRLTHIRTPEKKALYVPNSLFSTIIIENLSRINHRRIQEVIEIRHQDIGKAEKIIADIKDLLKQHSEIDQDHDISVNLSKLEKGSAHLKLEAFTKSMNSQKYNDIKQEILIKVSEIITKNNAQIAAHSVSLFSLDKETPMDSPEE